MLEQWCAVEGCRNLKVGFINNKGFCIDHINQVVDEEMARVENVRSGMVRGYEPSPTESDMDGAA
jgi:hypothetical protein